MRIAVGGRGPVVGAVGVTAIGLVLVLLGTEGSGWGLTLAGLAGILLGLWFFRDPEREPAPGTPATAALAPADGRVTDVRVGADGRTHLAIYLDLRDVHVVRTPLPVELIDRRREGRGHRHAASADAGGNVRLAFAARTGRGPLELVLVTGFIARRIVPYVGSGDRLDRGGRVGLIRFGSRVETRLPRGFITTVQQGQRVRAGVSVVALPPPGEEEERA